MSAQLKLPVPGAPRTIKKLRRAAAYELRKWLEANHERLAACTVDEAVELAKSEKDIEATVSSIRSVAREAGVVFKPRPRERAPTRLHVVAGKVPPSSVVLAKYCRFLERRDLALYEALGMKPDPIDPELERLVDNILNHRRLDPTGF